MQSTPVFDLSLTTCPGTMATDQVDIGLESPAATAAKSRRQSREGALPANTPVPDVDKHMKCSVCGSRKINTKPELYPGGVEAMGRGRP